MAQIGSEDASQMAPDSNLERDIHFTRYAWRARTTLIQCVNMNGNARDPGASGIARRDIGLVRGRESIRLRMGAMHLFIHFLRGVENRPNRRARIGISRERESGILIAENSEF